MRLSRLSAFVASDEAEVVVDSVLRVVESELEVVGEDGSRNGAINIVIVRVSELVMAHVVIVLGGSASFSVLPLDGNLVVTALLVGVELGRRAKLHRADRLNRRFADFRFVRIRPRSVSAAE